VGSLIDLEATIWEAARRTNTVSGASRSLMPTRQENDTRGTSLRLWPGVVIVLLQWLARFGLPLVNPGFTMYAVMAGLIGWLALMVWWLFFSRAEGIERYGAIA